MALTIYEGIKNNQLVDEDIDQVILRLLGLEDINDLDYDTYKTLLKEKMMSGRMRNTAIPSEETEKLTDEYKRVKRETGRFKVKKKPIKKDSFTPPNVSRGTRTRRSGKRLDGNEPSQKFLPTSSKADEIEDTITDKKQGSMGVMDFLRNAVSPSLTSIQKSLASVLNNNIKKKKAEQKAASDAKKAGEKEKSREKESRFESAAVKKLSGAAQKVLEPVKGIFDTIWNFIKNIGLGIAALRLIEFLTDPGKFFRDLGNQIIDALNTVIKSVFDVLFWPMNQFINVLNGAVNEFEFAINNTIGKIPGIPDLKLPDIPNIESPQIPKIKEPTTAQGMAGGGQVDSSTGTKISSMGSDTQLVALQPGEVVMSKKAVDAYGADTLLGMNAAAGGTNTPKMGMVPGYQGGGMVGGGYGTSEQRKMLDAISFAEGTTKSYGTVYGGQNVPDLAAGKMTIGQVLEMQRTGMHKGKQVYKKDGYDSDATGRYQFMSYVLREEASKQSKSMDTLFTPAMQDELILGRISRFRGVTPELLKQQGMSDKVIDMLAPEFASFPNLFGPDAKGRVGTNSSYYGQGGKSASAIKKAYGDSTDVGGSSTTPSSPTGRQNLPPSIRPPMSGSSGGGGTSVVMAGGGGSQQSLSSSAGGNQSVAPMFSPIDENNPELLVVKSIYNIVG